jgi:hypothetical protein
VRGEKGADGGGALEDVDYAGWEAGLSSISEVVGAKVGLSSRLRRWRDRTSLIRSPYAANANGLFSDDLRTKVLPAAMAGAIFQAART